LSRLARCSHRQAADGFTLVEVLVALAVIAILLASIGSLIAGSVRGVRSLDQHFALVEIARAIETGLPGRDELKVGRFSGEVSGHRWNVDVTRSYEQRRPAAAPPWVPLALVITVRSPAGPILRVNTCGCAGGRADETRWHRDRASISGFTLIETLIAVAMMVAIIAALAP
jgi:general secretion pathway protein I